MNPLSLGYLKEGFREPLALSKTFNFKYPTTYLSISRPSGPSVQMRQREIDKYYDYYHNYNVSTCPDGQVDTPNA